MTLNIPNNLYLDKDLNIVHKDEIAVNDYLKQSEVKWEEGQEVVIVSKKWYTELVTYYGYFLAA